MRTTDHLTHLDHIRRLLIVQLLAILLLFAYEHDLDGKVRNFLILANLKARKMGETEGLLADHCEIVRNGHFRFGVGGAIAVREPKFRLYNISMPMVTIGSLAYSPLGLVADSRISTTL